MANSRKGITAVSVGFSQPLESGSAENSSLYQVLAGVKKKKKTVYTKSLKIRGVIYSGSTNSVSISLAKPYKGAVELAVNGAIEALDGAISNVDFTTIIR